MTMRKLYLELQQQHPYDNDGVPFIVRNNNSYYYRLHQWTRLPGGLRKVEGQTPVPEPLLHGSLAAAAAAEGTTGPWVIQIVDLIEAQRRVFLAKRILCFTMFCARRGVAFGGSPTRQSVAPRALV
ncbi:hypothetical protein VOLCADRAFT_95022 [Volvox carteri f. nagariensis]|uniref:Uncharacterized protein n=1 Tax=Volvox carteri f. nagariensis TaxID=3068 RepID=D8U6E2_VOLCA|nr:uncharacterized protein VOLCADRAFT_95022 [Volvox carteri f. nagariensis]EFJ44701.1 hypothetical protein VOLCADRAFT_95022 [Volvox carteri f. nagariensis]|eukprot:XP_002954277.1 hypothetical protein VOLCADRAFT_95022 [Volvox carteri f. nagariensis]